jgi:hypothetical protein
VPEAAEDHELVVRQRLLGVDDPPQGLELGISFVQALGSGKQVQDLIL